MPQSIAVLGASADRRKYGNKCVRAYQQAGWTVHPVNPNESEIEGLEVVPRLADLPGGIDRISVYLPPPTTRELLPEMAAIVAGEVFFNPGAADAEVRREAERLGLPARYACSIVDIGLRPADFP